MLCCVDNCSFREETPVRILLDDAKLTANIVGYLLAVKWKLIDLAVWKLIRIWAFYAPRDMDGKDSHKRISFASPACKREISISLWRWEFHHKHTFCVGKRMKFLKFATDRGEHVSIVAAELKSFLQPWNDFKRQICVFHSTPGFKSSSHLIRANEFKRLMHSNQNQSCRVIFRFLKFCQNSRRLRRRRFTS
jgi:hypothetical protein